MPERMTPSDIGGARERFAAEDRQWIEDWRNDMFSSSSRDVRGWPIEMHGVIESWEKCLDALEKIEKMTSHPLGLRRITEICQEAVRE